jgi:hypothetical protein
VCSSDLTLESKAVSASKAQSFKLAIQPDGRYKLFSALDSSYCIALKGDSVASGTVLVLAKSTTSAAQNFKFDVVK